MKEYAFPELGYFGAGDIHKLSNALNGKTYMNFRVGYVNQAGNCTLLVMTDYDAPEEEIKNFFLHVALTTLANLAKFEKEA